jgi:CO dehydrogenase/acetyl-CoA synthase beta subunit
LIWVRPHWQKKALKLADQHPKSTGLKLVQVEMLYDEKLDIAEKLPMSYMPSNLLMKKFYSKANIYSKRDQHDKAVELLKLL